MKTNLIAAMLIVLALAPPAASQPEEGDAMAGRELASELCTACHIVGTERVGSDVAPPFLAIAKDPDVSLAELHGWGGPHHPTLPNLALTPEQIADINAYLESLRGADPGGEPERPAPARLPPAIEGSPPERIGPPIGPEPD